MLLDYLSGLGGRHDGVRPARAESTQWDMELGGRLEEVARLEMSRQSRIFFLVPWSAILAPGHPSLLQVDST
ncbi:hypothetical protein B296_00016583 [Ensete ventricosum]|uniref:Uncharacterized protein n=1 Tax=Ensete ventricosum TaxID=4639 RepID=A0A426XC90_ENSVE|nr:hypothetical protein B296_00016583 [Ensete ventricosum]